MSAVWSLQGNNSNFCTLAQVLHSGTERACNTRTLQCLAQTDLDWSEFKQTVPKYQLPHVQSSFALSAEHDSTNDYRLDVRKPYMARTVSSKARSAGHLFDECTHDSQIPVSAMYQRKQQAQINAAVEAECSSVRVNSMYQHTVSIVQPYLHAHTRGLAYTYGDRPRDQLRMTADLINSMREASSMSPVPKATSWIVAKSNLWPASAADSTSGLTAQKQGIAHQSQIRRM